MENIELPTLEQEENHIEVDELVARLGDHRWRLNNLYFVRNEKGQKVPFKLNNAQEELADNLWYLTILPKARQLGMTTFFTIFYLDQVLFSENKIAGIISHREEDMKRIFRGKIMFALEHLHPWLKKYVGQLKISTANEIVFENGGSMFVSLSTRSQTPNFLHISEYGYICAHAPDKADEILNGAINSVHAGQMISIESTAEGREGHFYRLCMEAERARAQNRKLTSLDFKIIFFPWWRDPRYILPDEDVPHVPQSQGMKDYFKVLEGKHGITLTDNQKAWYIKKQALLAEGMYQEFPSILEECFHVSLEGAYYANEMAKVYEEKRIGFFPVDSKFEVNTAWDLGMNDHNVIVFFQEIGPEIRIVDFYENNNIGLEHYVKHLRDKGYRYGRHILPHDAGVRDLSAKSNKYSDAPTREQVLWELGMYNTVVTGKPGVGDGIEKVRGIFSRFRFNEETTKTLTDALANYRKGTDKQTGVFKNQPLHDKNSHRADAIRVLALGYGGEQFEYGDEKDSGVKFETYDFGN